MMPESASLQFGPHYDVAAHSSAGIGPSQRVENQDNLLLIDGQGQASFLLGQRPQRRKVAAWPAGHLRLAVLDGMGGHGRGREAAEAVVSALLAVPACANLVMLCAELDALHMRLQEQFKFDKPSKRPGTTLTLLEIAPGKAPLLYHVGDSRLYEVTADRATPLTVDHVPATAFAMAGLLHEQEWWQQVHGEHRSQISQAFILGNAFTNPALLSDPIVALMPPSLPPYLAHLADRRAVALDADATYVLATDGFWSCGEPSAWVARWPQLLAGAGSARAVELLFGELELAPPPEVHPDNLTAIVLRKIKPDDETALPTHRAEN